MATGKPTFKKSTHTANTLADLLLRIKDYIALLRTLAAYLGDTVADGKLKELSTKINNTPAPNLEAITEALLEITNLYPSLDSTAITLGTNTQITGKATTLTITIPKGFYGKETTFTIESLGDSSKVDNAPAPTDVIAGKDYWANGNHLTGLLVDNSGKPVTATSTTAASAGEGLTITLKVATAKYDTDSTIDTGIIARNPVTARDKVTGKINGIDVAEDGTYKPIVKLTTDSEGSETFTVSAVLIPAGYYAAPIKVMPVFEDRSIIENVINTTTKEININHSTDSTHKWEFSPVLDSADYYTNVKVNIAAAALTPSALDTNLKPSDNTASVTVPVVTQGYTDSSTYTVNLKTATPVTTKDTTAKSDASAEGLNITPSINGALTVTIPAGLYTTDTVVKVNPMSSGDTVTATNISVKETPTENTETGKFTVTVAVNKSGYIASGDYVASDLNKSVITSTNVTNNVITALTITVSTNEGYTKGENKTWTVQDAVISGLSATKANGTNNAILTVSTAGETGKNGWFDGENVALTLSLVKTLVDNLTTVETLSYNSTNTSATTAIANTLGATVTSVDGSYYNKVDMSVLLGEMSAL